MPTHPITVSTIGEIESYSLLKNIETNITITSSAQKAIMLAIKCAAKRISEPPLPSKAKTTLTKSKDVVQ